MLSDLHISWQWSLWILTPALFLRSSELPAKGICLAYVFKMEEIVELHIRTMQMKADIFCHVFTYQYIVGISIQMCL